MLMGLYFLSPQLKSQWNKWYQKSGGEESKIQWKSKQNSTARSPHNVSFKAFFILVGNKHFFNSSKKSKFISLQCQKTNNWCGRA